MEGATPRERLLDAVVDVALADGVADKSLRAIAVAAGTSHRMLIHHFGSREGLLVEVIGAVEARQRAILSEMATGPLSEQGLRFWEQLRAPDLAPQERLFFEVYGQALQGRGWAQPAAARAIARLMVATGRGMLLDVLATGEVEEADAAMRIFSQMLRAHLASG